MADIAGEVMKMALGRETAGEVAAGHGVAFDPESARMDGDGTAKVTLKRDDKSHEQKIKALSSHENAGFVTQQKNMSPSDMLKNAIVTNDKLMSREHDRLARFGLDKKIDKMQSHMSTSRPPNSARASPASNPKLAKTYAQFRQHAEVLAKMPQRLVRAFNPEMLPAHEMVKLRQDAKLRGASKDPMGKSIAPSPMGVGKMMMSATRAAFKKWEHALMGGFVDAPSPYKSGDSSST
ncbi:MAG: hypothetical protein P4M15_12000 [Alphaproteobacteria bacterium]|nr:hypothetical protein [Alphaproteobacteria bacterium]